ncbi:MAG: 2,5-diketo-D-gluconate reductase [Thermotogaceae bacterium]|nr:2,5-diketo-D-gluconate reductase [Thermotogaceae bacterium]
MEELYKDGLIRAIGVSNFYTDRLMDLIVHHEVVPAVNQIEIHPFYQRQEEIEFMRNYNIQPGGLLLKGETTYLKTKFSNQLLKSITKQSHK